jgi:xylulokinase
LSETPVFTPYLGGVRTPHNNPQLSAAFSALTFAATRRHLVQGVMEGVALALGDCHHALLSSGAPIGRVALVGGGARSRFWAALIASVIRQPITLSDSAAFGPALGAARLARAGVGGLLIASQGVETIIQPEPHLAEALSVKHRTYLSHLKLG